MIIESVESEQYGTYNQECIGVLDFPLMADTLDVDEWFSWTEKFHPKSYRGFSAWGLKHLANGPKPEFVERGYNIYAVMVPTDRVNPDWSAEGTNYQRQMRGRKIKQLPIAASPQAVLKWQMSLSILVPDGFSGFKSLDELKTRYQKEPSM